MTTTKHHHYLYRDEIELRGEHFMNGMLEAVTDYVYERVCETASEAEYDLRGDKATVKFTVKADDLWDLYEAVKDIEGSLVGYASITIDKARVTHELGSVITDRSGSVLA